MRANNIFLVYCILIILLVGCSYSYTIESKYVPPNNTLNEFPFSTALILDSDYCDYSNSVGRGQNTLIFKLGSTLCDNTKSLIGNIFRDFKIYSNMDEAKKAPFQLLIIPKVVDSSTLFDESNIVLRTHTSILVEWTFINQQGRIIFLTTAEGSGSVQAKLTTSWDKAMNDLFNNLYEEIISSQELQSFADTI